MTWHLVGLDATPPQPWRNGGGLTRELLAWPDAGSWQVRISVADIGAAGPFSRFPGVERWFAVLEGAGVVLRVGAGAQTLTPRGTPIHFGGEAPADCSLVDGPTRDFNLMAAPGRGRLHRVMGALAFRAEGDALVAVYAHSRPATVRAMESEIAIPPRHLAWCHRTWAASGTVAGDDALWMEVRT